MNANPKFLFLLIASSSIFSTKDPSRGIVKTPIREEAIKQTEFIETTKKIKELLKLIEKDPMQTTSLQNIPVNFMTIKKDSTLYKIINNETLNQSLKNALNIFCEFVENILIKSTIIDSSIIKNNLSCIEKAKLSGLLENETILDLFKSSNHDCTRKEYCDNADFVLFDKDAFIHMSFVTLSLIDTLIRTFEETINQNFPKQLNLDSEFITIKSCILTKECKYIHINIDEALHKLINDPKPDVIMIQCLHPCEICSSSCQSKHQ